MITLDTEARTLAGLQSLPAAAVRELVCGTAAGKGHVPTVGHGDRFRKGHCHCPAADGGSAAVGDVYIHLISSAPRIGRRGRAGVRGEHLASQQQAGQQNCRLDQSLHDLPLKNIALVISMRKTQSSIMPWPALICPATAHHRDPIPENNRPGTPVRLFPKGIL
jgi:hypothetical protein